MGKAGGLVVEIGILLEREEEDESCSFAGWFLLRPLSAMTISFSPTQVSILLFSAFFQSILAFELCVCSPEKRECGIGCRPGLL